VDFWVDHSHKAFSANDLNKRGKVLRIISSDRRGQNGVTIEVCAVSGYRDVYMCVQ